MRRLILDPPNAEPPWRYLKWQDACTAIRTADEQHGPDSKEPVPAPDIAVVTGDDAADDASRCGWRITGPRAAEGSTGGERPLDRDGVHGRENHR